MEVSELPGAPGPASFENWEIGQRAPPGMDVISPRCEQARWYYNGAVISVKTEIRIVRIRYSFRSRRSGMKTTLVRVLLAAGLCIPAIAAAQSTQTQSSDQQAQRHEQQEQNQAATANMTGGSMQNQHHMTGKVIEDGKRFFSDNTSYPVANPKVLKKYNNQTVSIEFWFETSTNQLRVTKVSPDKSPSQ